MAVTPFTKVCKRESHCLYSFRGRICLYLPRLASWLTSEHTSLACVQLAHWKVSGFGDRSPAVVWGMLTLRKGRSETFR